MDKRSCNDCNAVVPYYAVRCAECARTIIESIEPAALNDVSTASFDGLSIYVESPHGSICFTQEMLDNLIAFKKKVEDAMR